MTGMVSTMKVIVYGAGDYCDRFLESSNNKKNVIYIADSDKEKWGKNKKDIEIINPNILSKIDFDILVVAVYRYSSALETILDLGVLKIGQIYIYDGNKELVCLKDIYDDYLENSLRRKDLIRQVKTSMILESFCDKEFEGYYLINVIGKKDDYELLKEVFGIYKKNIEVVHTRLEDLKLIKKDEKYVICIKGYRELLDNNRELFESDRQWMILPLYDVDKAVYNERRIR